MANRILILAATAAVIAVGGYIGYRQLAGGTTTTTAYANVNIDIGATALPDTAACDPDAGHARLVCLAGMLKATLTPDLLARLEQPYSVEAARQWSNFPPMGFQDRVGPTLGDFTPDQRAIIKAILLQAAGTVTDEGYDELEQVLNADDYLIAQTGESGFSSSNYHIAFLGTPGVSGLWQLYFGGHHFAMTNTYANGALIGATPSFRGVEPFVEFAQNGRDNAPMVQEQAAFAAMLSALTPEQVTAATLAAPLDNIIAGPQQDDAIPATAEGIRLGDTAPATQALALAAIATYVDDVAALDADAIMARYAAEIADTYVAFNGPVTVDAEGSYVRLDGPSVWIEFSLQPGRSIDGIHPHSVWRDKTADYGGN